MPQPIPRCKRCGHDKLVHSMSRCSTWELVMGTWVPGACEIRAGVGDWEDCDCEEYVE